MNTTCSLGAEEETKVDILPIQDQEMVRRKERKEETKVDILPFQERVRRKSESLEAQFMKLETKIHRFPPALRGIENRYIVPSFVALGPYHHVSAHLQHAEDVKHAAAHYFCEQSGHSVEEVYGKILSIADQARSCYPADDDAVARFSDAEFAEMMFLDGCFLLTYMEDVTETSDVLLNRMTLSTGPCMLWDIFLLENQLPWLVLEKHGSMHVSNSPFSLWCACCWTSTCV